MGVTTPVPGSWTAALAIGPSGPMPPMMRVRPSANKVMLWPGVTPVPRAAWRRGVARMTSKPRPSTRAAAARWFIRPSRRSAVPLALLHRDGHDPLIVGSVGLVQLVGDIGPED